MVPFEIDIKLSTINSKGLNVRIARKGRAVAGNHRAMWGTCISLSREIYHLLAHFRFRHFVFRYSLLIFVLSIIAILCNFRSKTDQ